MFDIDLYKEVWQAISKNRMRSILTAFGVMWGIFMLVAMSGAGNGLENGILHNYAGFATNAAFVWTMPTAKPYKGFQKGRRWRMNNGDMKAIRQTTPEIEYLVPRLQGHFQNTPNNTLYKERYGSFYLNGDYPELSKVETFQVIEGRFLNQIDINDNRKVCVIGTRVAEVLFSNGKSPLGEYIRVSGVYFKIVGVYSAKNSRHGDDRNKVIHIPFTTMQKAFNYGDIVHYFSFTARLGNKVSDIENKIIEIVKKRNSIAPDDIQAVGHFNVERNFEMTSKLFMGIKILTFIVGLGTLLAGVIGISNILLVIVKERTTEIGIKRAIGATPYSIIKQIMLEAVFLTVTAGYLGLVLGVILNEVLGIAMSQNPDSFFREPGISFSTGIAALFTLVIAGAFAGLLPAVRAVSVKPIDAIRDE